ncbi:precorrin-3B C(17)-methyltransferase [Halorhabdus rudnickae]|uniref:precorrin-3B C(17)-methyltransferase n=1 Tax=Halorhabdus rudnickae TaxID=1775544 RepID=UPI001FCE3AA6|nr:precorrin-3B C(17)-methyltransferase [Halorhabdus rudnickae]
MEPETAPERDTDGRSAGIDTDADSIVEGSLAAVGLGPGHDAGMTIRARETLEAVDQIVGYETYVELLPESVRRSADAVHATGMGTEVSRTETAVDRALDGASVALVASGDPNVYALGGLVLEILESREIHPDRIDFEVVPGVPAAQSSAARLGAPLVTDTVSISLSDHLTPLSDIESRLRAVAPTGMVVVLYNPWSPNRAQNFQLACDILSAHRDPETPVGIVRGAGRADERTHVTDLETLPELGESDLLDMTSTIVVGTERTRVWGDRLLTPRGYERKYDY